MSISNGNSKTGQLSTLACARRLPQRLPKLRSNLSPSIVTSLNPAFGRRFDLARKVAVAVLALAVAGLCSHAQPATIQEFAYGPLPRQRLNLCANPTSSAPRPGVLLIHGGGFSGGDKSSLDHLCRELASKGFVAASVGYRLAPDARWPAQLADAQGATRWLKDHAGAIGLDPQRLCAVGFSAGGSLAILLGAAPGGAPPAGESPTSNDKPAVQCVVSDSGITLISALDPKVRDTLWKNLFRDSDRARRAKLLRDASPLYKVDRNASPMLLICGEKDRLTPPSQCAKLKKRLTAAGVDVRVIAHDGGHLGEGLTDEQRAGVIRQIISFLQAKLQ